MTGRSGGAAVLPPCPDPTARSALGPRLCLSPAPFSPSPRFPVTFSFPAPPSVAFPPGSSLSDSPSICGGPGIRGQVLPRDGSPPRARDAPLALCSTASTPSLSAPSLTQDLRSLYKAMDKGALGVSSRDTGTKPPPQVTAPLLWQELLSHPPAPPQAQPRGGTPTQKETDELLFSKEDM